MHIEEKIRKYGDSKFFLNEDVKDEEITNEYTSSIKNKTRANKVDG